MYAVTGGRGTRPLTMEKEEPFFPHPARFLDVAHHRPQRTKVSIDIALGIEDETPHLPRDPAAKWNFSP